MSRLSRYILREFIVFLLYTILAFVVIFVLVDLVENIDSFINNETSPPVIALYYIVYLPYILVLTLPVAMLLSTMFSLGRLVSDNEVTALKASGVSLYRILVPLYVFALIVGCFVMVFAEYVVPRTNFYMEEIERKGDDFDFSLTVFREMDRSNVYLINGDGRIVYAANYRSRNQVPHDVVILAADSLMTPRAGVESRIEAGYMTFENGVWTLHEVIVYEFSVDSIRRKTYASYPGLFLTLTPSDFARIDLEPEEMDYFQLKDYIASMRAKGNDVSEWLVDLYMKISFPFVSFVMVFFGAPLAAGSSKRAKTASFGIALAISFVFYTLINAFQIFGRNGTLDPLVAAWAPNIVFIAIGMIMHMEAKK